LPFAINETPDEPASLRPVEKGSRRQADCPSVTTFQTIERSPTNLAVIGELDLATAPSLALALTGRGPKLDLDMSECSFIDSSGIALLVEHKAGPIPGLRIVAPNHVVMRVLSICNLAEILVGGSDSPDLAASS
jgi:anti-sigma B factor antagonist